MQGECVWFGKRDVPYRDLPIVTRVDTVRSPMERRYFRDIADDRGLDWEYCGRVLADRDIAEYMRRP